MIALSDTGPLISAFQSNSYSILLQIFDAVYTTPTCISELIRHGYQRDVDESDLQVIQLTTTETQFAYSLAQRIEAQPSNKDPIIENHLGEAEIIAVANRASYGDDLILLDEEAARTIARELGLSISGFPGALLSAVQLRFITPDELRERLEDCRSQGTHYGVRFIDSVFQMAQRMEMQ